MVVKELVERLSDLPSGARVLVSVTSEHGQTMVGVVVKVLEAKETRTIEGINDGVTLSERCDIALLYAIENK